MRVLIYSPAFLPAIGGLEIVQAQLALELTRLGQEVTVVTLTPAAAPDATAARARGVAPPAGGGAAGGAAPDGDAALPYRVLRRPGPAALLAAVHDCEVFFQANLSLRGLWPLLLVRRPWAVSHHSWYCRSDGRIAWQDRLKRRLLRRAALSISVSRAMAADLATPSLVIENAYRDELFRELPEVPRDRELIFLGRLVSDKGADLLLAALGRLAAEGLRPRLTMVGDGPEAAALARQAAALGLDRQVELAGSRRGGELVEMLNRHRILVVPSRYHEPFGVVALEGIACGCVVVGSRGGGLPDAIGPCGRLFDNGDAEQLAAVLGELLRQPQEAAALRQGAAEHLAAHRGAAVARRYLAALAGVVAGGER